ncbi:MAG: copper chaperone PCu(A)C [Gemmatimonadales bacterium]
MNRGVLAIATLCVACGAEPPPDALPVAAKGGLEIYHAYAPASPAPDVASLYFTVVNTGRFPDTLTGVRSDAGRAMVHETVTEHGLSAMQHVSAIAIEPRDTLRLVPGSYHVMLSNLARPLEVGDTVTVHLQFTRTGELRVEAPVLTYTDVVELLEGER